MKKTLSNILKQSLMISALGLMACSGSSTANGAAAKEGDSCEGISSSTAKMACDGSRTLFCSSFTKYKFIVQTTCKDPKVCKMADDGKSARCADKS